MIKTYTVELTLAEMIAAHNVLMRDQGHNARKVVSKLQREIPLHPNFYVDLKDSPLREECPRCHGGGEIVINNNDFRGDIPIPCPGCGGSGVILQHVKPIGRIR